eukprot:5776093-Pleurochrysis_carterae.AAC.1
MPSDASGHRPSFNLRRNGGLYELHAQLTPPRVSGSGATNRPRSLTVRAARATSHIHAMPTQQAAEYMHRRLHAGDARLRGLPDVTTDAPPALRGARLGPCHACATANAPRLSHPHARYNPSYAGR